MKILNFACAKGILGNRGESDRGKSIPPCEGLSKGRNASRDGWAAGMGPSARTTQTVRAAIRSLGLGDAGPCDIAGYVLRPHKTNQGAQERHGGGYQERVTQRLCPKLCREMIGEHSDEEWASCQADESTDQS